MVFFLQSLWRTTNCVIQSWTDKVVRHIPIYLVMEGLQSSNWTKKYNTWRWIYLTVLFGGWWCHYYMVTWLWQVFLSPLKNRLLSPTSDNCYTSLRGIHRLLPQGVCHIVATRSRDFEKCLKVVYSHLQMIFTHPQVLVSSLLHCHVALTNLHTSSYWLATIMKKNSIYTSWWRVHWMLLLNCW